MAALEKTLSKEAVWRDEKEERWLQSSMVKVQFASAELAFKRLLALPIMFAEESMPWILPLGPMAWAIWRVSRPSKEKEYLLAWLV